MSTMLRLINPTSDDTILDAECGTGELVYACSLNGSTAIGVDFAKVAIMEAKRKIGKNLKADLIVCDAQNLPIKIVHLIKLSALTL